MARTPLEGSTGKPRLSKRHLCSSSRGAADTVSLTERADQSLSATVDALLNEIQIKC